jgi:ferredoxin-type protein NapH
VEGEKLLEIWKKCSYIVLIIFIVAGLFDFRVGIVAVVCMIAPIIIAVFRGRFWCGNLCPRGNFYDNVVSKISKQTPVPKVLKSVSFRSLVVVFMFTMFGLGIKSNWGNPFGIGMVIYRIIVVTTFVGVGLSFFFNHRTWCNFCPMGSLAALVSYFTKDKKVLEVNDSCVSCKICSKRCPMGILPYQYKGEVLDNADCIQCFECKIACPKKSIGYEKNKIKE